MGVLDVEAEKRALQAAACKDGDNDDDDDDDFETSSQESFYDNMSLQSVEDYYELHDVDADGKQIDDWAQLNMTAPQGMVTVTAVPVVGNSIIGMRIMHRVDTEGDLVWMDGTVAFAGTARTLRNGWNYKVRFGEKLVNCLLLPETYGANDEARWRLLKKEGAVRSISAHGV
jgi:hypothetical protein